MRVGAGAFELIYDPSIGEGERWYINDHTFIRGHRGTWHLIGPTESPFVVERNCRHYLFIGPDWRGLLDSYERDGRYDRGAYRRTRVITSDDPFHFEISNQVGTIDAHAAEVIADDDGRWWVSHCGWGQGGVYLAPLHWDD